MQGLSDADLRGWDATAGAAIKGRRDAVLLSTKTSLPMGEGPNEAGSSRLRLVHSVEEALARLETDYLDLLQLHAYDAGTPVEEVLYTLDVLVRAGKVRYVGVSNFSGWQIMKSLAVADRYGWPRYVANQVEDDYLFRVVDALEEVARETGKSVPQIALNWLLHRPTVASVIIGARNEPQLRENLAAVGWRLDAQHVTKLEKASAVTAAYPYFPYRRQAGFARLNPPPA